LEDVLAHTLPLSLPGVDVNGLQWTFENFEKGPEGYIFNASLEQFGLDPVYIVMIFFFNPNLRNLCQV